MYTLYNVQYIASFSMRGIVNPVPKSNNKYMQLLITKCGGDDISSYETFHGF